MKVFYSRVSTVEQNDSRQLEGTVDFDKVMRDRCSGVIALWDRPKGKEIYKLILSGKLKELHIHSIDRLGRDTVSVLQIWRELTEKGVRVVCRNPNFQNFREDGEPDIFSDLMISILSTMSDFEKKLIQERQKEGIEKAKIDGRYLGRKNGTKETLDKFLDKPKSRAIIQDLKNGYPTTEIKDMRNCSHSTIHKVIKTYKEVIGVDLMERKVKHLG
jgi:DNA invertase Pin-like site-specific DNA recombinase